MAAFRLQIASLVFLTSDFPGDPTFARYGDLTARVGGGTIRRFRDAREPSAEFSFFKVEDRIFAEWDVLGEEVVEIV